MHCIRLRTVSILFAAPLTASCSGIQSALAPAGTEAARIAELFWWMTDGTVLVWGAVVAMAIYYGRSSGIEPNRRRDTLLIAGAGVAVPTVTLAVLLVFGLRMIPSLVARAPDGSLEVRVVGEQWWWRVQYLRPDGTSVELANEIALPVGEPVQFQLESDNVIHSFWVPSLGGKLDMIPGRVTYLTLHPTETGVFRGACAEYCGASHAFMNFFVRVLEEDEFRRWLDRQAAPAAPPGEPGPVRGGTVFVSAGCGACHTIRGTRARGSLGPDLTHVGSRLSLAAGILPNDPAAFLEWIGQADRLKPGAHMPRFDMLPAGDIRALAAYLDGLR